MAKVAKVMAIVHVLMVHLFTFSIPSLPFPSLPFSRRRRHRLHRVVHTHRIRKDTSGEIGHSNRRNAMDVRDSRHSTGVHRARRCGRGRVTNGQKFDQKFGEIQTKKFCGHEHEREQKSGGGQSKTVWKRKRKRESKTQVKKRRR